MKKVLAPLVLAALVFTGCNQTTTTSGKKDGKELKLTTPKSVSIEQGGTAKVKVSVERTKFDEDVTVKFDKLPEGVTVEEDGKLAKGVKEREFTLKATSAAKAGKVTAKVSASGGGVDTDAHEVAIEIKEKKEKPDTTAEFKKKREALDTAAQAKLKEIDAALTELKAEAKTADAKVKGDIEKEIKSLDEKRSKLDAQAKEIATHAEQGWEAFATSVSSAADDLHKGVTDAVKKFKKK